MHSDGQREKCHLDKTPPQVTARSGGEKSADFSYSHKKIRIRNASADWSRLARSSPRVLISRSWIRLDSRADPGK